MKPMAAITGRICIIPLLWNPKNPIAQAMIKTKPPIKSIFDIFCYY